MFGPLGLYPLLYQHGITETYKEYYQRLAGMTSLSFQVTHTLSPVHNPPGICSVGGQRRRGREERSRTSGFGSDLLLKSPPPSSSSLSPSAEPCLRQGAATYPAPSVITPGTLNLMPPRIRRSLILPHRPSTLPRLRLKMAAHSPPLSKR